MALSITKVYVDLGSVNINQRINDESKENEVSEHDIKFVITGKDTTKPLYPAEQSFNLISELIQRSVVYPRILTVAFRWYNRCVV